MTGKLLVLILSASGLSGAAVGAAATALSAPAAAVAPPASATVVQSAATPAPTDDPTADPTLEPTPAPLPVDTTPHPGQISTDFVISTIETQFSEQAGGSTVTVTCPRTGLFASVAGDSFDCDVVSISVDGAERDAQVEVDVTSAASNWTWSVR